MRILVTGSDGYIGTCLTQVLIKAGHDVVALDTGFYRSGWLYNVEGVLPSVVTKDTRHVTAADIQNFDAVVHLAELSNDPLGQTNEKITYDINHYATLRLAELCKAAKIPRFIYFSSCSVYGASDEVSDENSITRPLTAYAKSKVMNEEALRQLADDTFSPVFLRNATAFGPSPRLRFDLAVNNLAGSAWVTGEVRLESDGQAWRPFVHILDISQAVVRVLDAPRDIIHNEILNVGDTSANYLIIDVAKIVAKEFAGSTVTIGSTQHDSRNYRVSFDKINTRLPGFACRYSVADGVAQLHRMFRRTNLSKEVFESKDYTRLKQINYLLKNNQVDSELFWQRAPY